ncbi:C39 family peptidase [Ureibacillus chungkukjangi]|uniref:C39 family peptidase n=1 Tax=Ureibacillus chungkukjangi TaxID=1202712 RepID=UPI0020419B24
MSQFQIWKSHYLMFQREKKFISITASTSENNYPSVEEFSFKNSNPYHVNSNSNQNIAVQTVMQNPELPNGCEITSLTAVLNYYGLQVTKTEMADNFLPQQDFRIEEGKHSELIQTCL